MQKPYASKCGQGKIKIDLFRDFFTKIDYFQVMNFIPVKVSTLYMDVLSRAKNSGRQCHFKSMSFQNLVRLSQIKKFPCLIMPKSTKCQKIN
jgi:hypothetical protein